MTDNIINLHDRGKLTPGETTFVTCDCDGSYEGETLTPVVLHDQQGPIITAVMCPNCEGEIPVVNGVLQMDQATLRGE